MEYKIFFKLKIMYWMMIQE